MLRLTIANALAHRSRLALTWLAVALGVAFVAGSLALTDTSNRLLDEQFRTAAANVDLTVRDAAAFDSGMGVEVQRDPLQDELVQQVSTHPAVASMNPAVSGQGILTIRGQAVVPNGPTVLASWAAPPFSAYTLRAGRPPVGADELVVDAATAAQHGIDIGDTVAVAAVRTAALTVVGITGVGDSDGLPNTTIALVALPTSQHLLDLGGGVTHVDVLTEDDIPVEQARTQLAKSLGGDVAVSSSQDSAASSAAAAKESLAYLRIVLLVLAAAGLVVGAFLITNTFSIVLAQRSRELALLRAAGATGRQIAASVLGEALLVGATGSLAGTAFGIGAANALRGAARGLGLSLPDAALLVSGRTVAVALGAGIAVTLLAAVGPARRAARTAPVEAMRESAAPAAESGRVRASTGGLALVSGVVLLAVAPLDGTVLLAGLGALLLVTGSALLGPRLSAPLVRLVGRPLRTAGVPGRLAVESAARAPRRTAATALTLALGLTLISFMSVLASSLRQGIGENYSETITAEYVVESSRNEMLGGLSPELAGRLEALPETAATSVVRFGHWLDGDVTSALTAVDPHTLPRVADIDLTAGSLTELESGGVIVAEQVAQERGLRIGDTLPMTFARTGGQQVPIVGLLEQTDAQALSTNYLISLTTYDEQFSERVDASVYVTLADGVSADEARAAVEATLADHPTAELRDHAAAVSGRAAMIDEVLGLVTVLLTFAVGLALLGITNTLALSIVERLREIGLLRAVGMTRSQLRAMVRGEAVLIAALAVAIGLGTGVAIAASTVSALGATTPLPMSVPVGQLLAVVAIATAGGLLAGLLPARRAGRLDVLEAIASQ